MQSPGTLPLFWCRKKNFPESGIVYVLLHNITPKLISSLNHWTFIISRRFHRSGTWEQPSGVIWLGVACENAFLVLAGTVVTWRLDWGWSPSSGSSLTAGTSAWLLVGGLSSLPLGWTSLREVALVFLQHGSCSISYDSLKSHTLLFPQYPSGYTGPRA